MNYRTAEEEDLLALLKARRQAYEAAVRRQRIRALATDLLIATAGATAVLFDNDAVVALGLFILIGWGSYLLLRRED